MAASVKIPAVLFSFLRLLAPLTARLPLNLACLPIYVRSGFAPVYTDTARDKNGNRPRREVVR